MLQIRRSRWRGCWHVYDVDTGGTVWRATFRDYADAADWISQHYSR